MILLREHREYSTKGAKNKSGFEGQVGAYLCKKDEASLPAEEIAQTKA